MHAQQVRNEMLKRRADIHKRLSEIVKESPKWFPRVIWYRVAPSLGAYEH